MTTGGSGHTYSMPEAPNTREQLPSSHDPHPLTDRGNKHGRVTSWILIAVVIGAFTLGGIALIFSWWWVVLACAGVCVLSLPTGRLIGIMQDTVEWTVPPPRHPEHRSRVDDLHRPT